MSIPPPGALLDKKRYINIYQSQYLTEKNPYTIIIHKGKNMLKKSQINEIILKIAELVKPKKIILFGSYARGNQTEDSDLDLLVILENSDLPRHKRARVIRQHLRGVTDIPRDILVYTQSEVDEWSCVKLSFVSTILQEGKILYEN